MPGDPARRLLLSVSTRPSLAPLRGIWPCVCLRLPRRSKQGTLNASCRATCEAATKILLSIRAVPDRSLLLLRVEEQLLFPCVQTHCSCRPPPADALAPQREAGRQFPRSAHPLIESRCS